LVTCQASQCKPRTKQSKPCYKIMTRDECLTSKDSRGGKYEDQECVWCLHQCPDGNFCEPKNFLTGKNKIDRIDFESCLQNTAETCQKRDKKKACYLIENRMQCLTTKDNRSYFQGQDCVWCPFGTGRRPRKPRGGRCWGRKNNCEPRGHLDRKGWKNYETCG